MVRRATSSILLGIVCAAGIIDSFESGMVSAIASGLVIVLLFGLQNCAHRLVLFVISAIATTFLVQLALRSTYGAFSFHKLNAFAGGFARGFGAVLMPSFGLWVFVFVFLSMAVVVAALRMFSIRTKFGNEEDNRLSRAAAISTFGDFSKSECLLTT